MVGEVEEETVCVWLRLWGGLDVGEGVVGVMFYFGDGVLKDGFECR